jgi:hypothetical protein
VEDEFCEQEDVEDMQINSRTEELGHVEAMHIGSPTEVPDNPD